MHWIEISRSVWGRTSVVGRVGDGPVIVIKETREVGRSLNPAEKRR